jgi:hypothetical protein
MHKVCKTCGNNFEILEKEKKFLTETFAQKFAGKKFNIPEPKNCPECRSLHRCAFRNEKTFYKRKCDKCSKDIVTLLSGDRPFPVYCTECWWGDSWDAGDYGRDIDFNRPFFEQLRELQDEVPRLSMNHVKCENSEYTNQGVGNKNSYLLFGSDDNEDCFYGYWINRCKDTADCNNTSDSTLCYDLTDCENCYNCIGSQDLSNCTECLFCFDCIGCSNCIRSAGLRNKKYWIDNKQSSKEEYEKEVKNILNGSYAKYLEQKKVLTEDVQLRIPHKYVHILNAENCTGDHLSSDKNCQHCYDCYDSEDCLYARNLVHQHFQTMDANFVTETKNAYQIQSVIGENSFFCFFTWYSSNIWYSDSVKQSHNIFGCIGLRRKEYCILNKKYSKEEYEELVSKLITHMQETNEFGEFFSPDISPYAYNETAAMDYHPIDKEKALSYGYRWKENIDEPPQVEKTIPASKLPDSADDIPDDVLNWAITCEKTGRPFQIIQRELTLLRKHNLPIPRLHSDERLRDRMALRNPSKLWKRECGKCGEEIETTYDPKRPETVYCEKCYLAEVY